MNTTLPSRNVLMGIVRIALILSLAINLFSCKDEQTPDPTPSGEEKTITLSLTTPQRFSPATYANPAAVNEDEIQTIDILIFKKEGDDSYTYFSGPHYGSLGDANNGTTPVTLRIPQNVPDDSKFAVFANSRKVIRAVNTFTVGEDEETTLKKIVLDDTESNQWETFENKNLIPMYGEVALADIASTSALLVRMVANINVTLGADALSDFDLKTVSLYNRNSKGYVASHLGPLSSLDADAVEYSVTSNKSDKEIYAFETTVAGDGTTFSTANTCIVIGGNYKGDTNKEYYYRIDFFGMKSGDTNNSYLPLTRNHRYNVSVVKIFGPGCDTADEAIISKPTNLKYEVKEWEEISIIYGG